MVSTSKTSILGGIRIPRLLTLALFVSALGACQPSLQEGVYGCDVHADCPVDPESGAQYFCRFDRRCHLSDDEQTLFSLCGDDDDCPAESDCSPGPVSNAPVSYCTIECEEDSECRSGAEAVGEIEGICVGGVCAQPCGLREDCSLERDYGCFLPAIGMPAIPIEDPICIGIGPMNSDGSTACTASPCLAPALCRQHPDVGDVGICTLSCIPGTTPETLGDGCPGNSALHACLETFVGVFSCFKSCQDIPCNDPLVCTEVDEGSFCLPPEWAAVGLPLPVPTEQPAPR